MRRLNWSGSLPLAGLALAVLTSCDGNAAAAAPVDHSPAGVLHRTLVAHHLPAIAGAVVRGDSDHRDRGPRRAQARRDRRRDAHRWLPPGLEREGHDRGPARHRGRGRSSRLGPHAGAALPRVRRLHARRVPQRDARGLAAASLGAAAVRRRSRADGELPRPRTRSGSGAGRSRGGCSAPARAGPWVSTSTRTRGTRSRARSSNARPARVVGVPHPDAALGAAGPRGRIRLAGGGWRAAALGTLRRGPRRTRAAGPRRPVRAVPRTSSVPPAMRTWRLATTPDSRVCTCVAMRGHPELLSAASVPDLHAANGAYAMGWSVQSHRRRHDLASTPARTAPSPRSR